MNTDKHRWVEMIVKKEPDKSVWVKTVKSFQVIKISLSFLSVFICVHLWLTRFAFAEPTPAPANAFDAASQALDNAKAETQKLKDAWDKKRLETTLYDQRAKRAYQKWTKAAKSLKDQAKAQKERAELEFQIAVEKRKLAYNDWQVAQLKMVAEESRVKALDQEKESDAIRKKIGEMEAKIKSGTQPAVGSSQ